MIVRGYYSLRTKIEPYIEVLVKEGWETNFYSPTGLNLPKYGRFERADQKQIRE